ncbi:laccase [Ceratobasidium sp. 392]|nr:laccase [Ceratobasidium sp. 392]
MGRTDFLSIFRYHSHLSSQYVDGLRGALIIYDPQDPQRNLYDVDDATTIITLEDWYHLPAPTLQAQFFSTNNTALAAPVPDSALINGKGRYIGGPAVPRAVINVIKGRRYRLRVINMSAIGSYTFSIEGHRLTIIEADGIAHQPLVVDSLDIYAGQRYSVILEANQTVANYWIRTPMTVANAANNPNLDATNVFAVLRYAGAPIVEPTTEPGTAIGTPLVEENLHALINPGAPGGSGPADVVVNLAIGRTTINGAAAFTFNGIQTDNPGPWFVHCHIDWHLEAGLALVFAEAPDQTRVGAQRVQPAPGWNQLCPKYAALPAALQ